ncbi:alcohol dehydrogenase [Thermogymnomonas acidicola]|uniref:Alcohol dehydrogenase n=1 Tax=Thermogymnomonas acidicola TaxID=399579 RepID=A0AA37FCH5_9ARCH|nr:zinc-binding dehydrogenase [Thermogymnomonas acidicola]GGM78980.1 alcohol dehydrogenase [Thermogymnomonas acidicola]
MAFRAREIVLPAVGRDLQVAESEVPEPEGDQVVIRQSVSGICFRDILTRDGFMPRVRTPGVIGHEISGTVVAAGPCAEYVKEGDRVASLIYRPCGRCEFCLTGRENLCPNKEVYGETLRGGYSDLAIVSEKSLVKVPGHIGEDEAAIAACVTGMVYHALKVVGNVQDGSRVLITGAGGGVGIHAVQVAKRLGATVIAETTSQSKVEAIHRAGADHVVVTTGRFDGEVKKLTDGGVDVALEAVGIATFESSLRSLRTGGTVVVVGNVQPEPVGLPLGLIILKGNRVEGSISSTRKDMMDVFELSRGGRIRAVVDRHIEPGEINRAYEDIRARKNTGRVLIKF